MALDRQSIERRDFPVGRRGYDPDAVDAHLSTLADEVAELRRASRTRGETLASAASDQVRAIVEAAETSATDIRRDAEADAREIRDEADASARQTRNAATEQARTFVGGVSDSAEAMLTRLNAMQTELDALLGALRAGAGRLSTELHTLQSELADIGGVVAPRAAFAADESSPGRSDGAALADEYPVDDDAGALDDAGLPTELPAEVSPVRATVELPGDVDPEALPASGDEVEGVRLIALNMALDGTPRAQVERYIAENFSVADSGALLDEVYASVEG